MAQQQQQQQQQHQLLQPSLSSSSISYLANDAYLAQVHQRRFNLLIRSAPTDAKALQRGSRRRSAAPSDGNGGAGESARSTSSLHGGHRGDGGQEEPTEASLDAARLLRLGQQRLAQSQHNNKLTLDSSASKRDAARLYRMYGADSSYARKQQRERQREEQLAAAVALVRAQNLLPQLVASTSASSSVSASARVRTLSPRVLRAIAHASVHGGGKGHRDGSSSGAEGKQLDDAIADRKALEGLHLRQRKIVLQWLTSTAPQHHHFFEHLPNQPALTLQSAERLLSVVRGHDATALLGHLRVLESSGAMFPSVARLVAAVAALEAREVADDEDRHSRERFPFREEEFEVARKQLRDRGGGGSGTTSFRGGGGALRPSASAVAVAARSLDFEARVRSQPHHHQQHNQQQGGASNAQAARERAEHDRLVASVPEAQRARLVAYFTSSSSAAGADEEQGDSVTAPDLGFYTVSSELDGGTVESRRIPSECRLFGDAELVSATPLQLNELIVDGGGLDNLLATLVSFDQEQHRVFPSFAALLLAVQGEAANECADKQARADLLDYFRRGEALWKEQHNHSSQSHNQQQQQQDVLFMQPSARSLLGASSSRRHVENESKENTAAASSASGAASARSPPRRGGAPLGRSMSSSSVSAAVNGGAACRAFLHLRTPPPHVDESAVDALVDESLSGSARDCLATLRSMEATTGTATGASFSSASNTAAANPLRARDLAHLTTLLLRENLSSGSARRRLQQLQQRPMLASFAEEVAAAQDPTTKHAARERDELTRFLNDPETGLFQPSPLLLSGRQQPQSLHSHHHSNILSHSHASSSARLGELDSLAFHGGRGVGVGGAAAVVATTSAGGAVFAFDDDADALLLELGGSVALAKGFIAEIVAARRQQQQQRTARSSATSSAPSAYFASGEELVSAVRFEHAQLRRELLRFFRSGSCSLLQRRVHAQPASVHGAWAAEGNAAAAAGVDPTQLRMAHMARLLLQSGFSRGSELFQALWTLQDNGSGPYASVAALLQALQSVSAALASQRMRAQEQLLALLAATPSSAPSATLLPKHIKVGAEDIARLWRLAGDDTPAIVHHLLDTSPASVSGAGTAATAAPSNGATAPGVSSPARSRARFDSFEALASAVGSAATQAPAQKQEILLHLLSKQSNLFDERRGAAWDPSLTSAHNASSSATASDDDATTAAGSLPFLLAPAGSLRHNSFAGAWGRFNFGTDATRLAEWTGPTLSLPLSRSPAPKTSSNSSTTEAPVLLSPAAASRLFREGGAGPATLRALWALEVARAAPTAAAAAKPLHSIDELVEAVAALATASRRSSNNAAAAAAADNNGSLNPSSPPPPVRSRRNSLASPSSAATTQQQPQQPAPPLPPPSSSTAPSSAWTVSSAAKTKPRKPAASQQQQQQRSPAASPPSTSRRVTGTATKAGASGSPAAAKKSNSTTSASSTNAQKGSVAMIEPPSVPVPGLGAPAPGLSAADKSLVLSYISSPSCRLFAVLAASGNGSQLAVRTGDIGTMVSACGGDGARVVELLRDLDARAQQFDSFQSLTTRVVDEARLADEKEREGVASKAAALTASECDTLLSFLSASPQLLDASLRGSSADASELSARVSKADLVRLAEAAGGDMEHVLATLRDLAAHGHMHRPPLPAVASLPARSWEALVDAAAQARQRLLQLRLPLLTYLRSVESQLFLSAAEAESWLSLEAMEALQLASGAGSVTQAHVRAMLQLTPPSSAQQQQQAPAPKFAALAELVEAIKARHAQHLKQLENSKPA
jgi:hypothetical protein